MAQENRQSVLQEVLENITAIYRLMGSSRDQFLASLGVNKPQIEVLFLLNEHPMNIKAIAQKLNITSSAVTQIVGNLVKNGLLLREASSTDKRETMIRLSTQGKKRFQKIRNVYMKKMEVVLSNIKDEQLRSLELITNQIIKIIEDKDE
ncbi:MarR family transcriptional regulator [Candidatus Saccharibacteria bacterium]|nr:MarR family transcriptional regulator [Candidatus Saccharibacteria bacterium]MBI3337684.1 MarR family transcriptional regulator [Candidatus Saccharibacteria bacterium]